MEKHVKIRNPPRMDKHMLQTNRPKRSGKILQSGSDHVNQQLWLHKEAVLAENNVQKHQAEKIAKNVQPARLL